MPSSDDNDEEELARHADALRAGLRRRLGRWAIDTVAGRLGRPLRAEELERIDPAIRRALDDLDDLLGTDIDRQTANPLAIVRSLVVPMNRLLVDADAPAPRRDADAIRLFPDDHHDLAPAAFVDIHPELHELGIVWGAAKAHVHLRRRRNEGQIP